MLAACALALAIQESARAAATVIVSGSAGGLQTLGDSDSVITGTASAEVAGGFSGDGFSQTFSASGFASSDSGRIGVAAGNLLTGTAPSPSSRATGTIEDVLMFMGTEPFEVEFSISLFGRFDNTGGPSGHSANLSLQLNNGFTHRITASWTPTTTSSPVFYGSTGSSSTVTITFPTGANRIPSNVNGSIRVRTVVTPGVPFPVEASLGVISSPAPNSATNVLFDQTAILALSVPEGTSYTSQSGSFLSVPEPATVLLLGLGGTLLFGRRRNGRYNDRIIAGISPRHAPGSFAVRRGEFPAIRM
jgi:hypothetical protein